MIKAPIRLQDLRRRIYLKAKAETFCGFRPGNFRASAGGGGVGMGCRTPCSCTAAVGISIFSESRSGKIGHISLGVKQTRKPSAGNLHAGFDAAGTGTQLTVWLVRHSHRKRRATARPNLRSMAPVLDPTGSPLPFEWRKAISKRTKAALAAAKARGTRLGGRRVSAERFAEIGYAARRVRPEKAEKRAYELSRH
jgi:hypothetical protein